MMILPTMTIFDDHCPYPMDDPKKIWEEMGLIDPDSIVFDYAIEDPDVDTESVKLPETDIGCVGVSSDCILDCAFGRPSEVIPSEVEGGDARDVSKNLHQDREVDEQLAHRKAWETSCLEAPSAAISSSSSRTVAAVGQLATKFAPTSAVAVLSASMLTLPQVTDGIGIGAERNDDCRFCCSC